MAAPVVQIAVPHAELAEFCRRWSVVELSLFGSVLRDDFGPQSDIDMMVEFAPGVRRTLFDLVRMENELAGLFGRDVDILVKRSVTSDENYLRRREILKNSCVIYNVGRDLSAGYTDCGSPSQGVRRRD